jgi:hypothetical protein
MSERRELIGTYSVRECATERQRGVLMSEPRERINGYSVRECATERSEVCS